MRAFLSINYGVLLVMMLHLNSSFKMKFCVFIGLLVFINYSSADDVPVGNLAISAPVPDVQVQPILSVNAVPAAAQPILSANADPATAQPVAVPIQPGQDEFIVNGAVYQIFNKLDGGVLTAGSGDDLTPIYDRANTGSAGQKWRINAATTAVFGKSYLIVPTLNERAVLDLDTQTVGILGRMAALGNQRYWKVMRMGEGVLEIRNYHATNLCLTSFGLDKEINTAECQNSPAQQWILSLL